MDFAQDVGRGLGKDWFGVLFRRKYPELKDVIEKTQKWFPRIFPGCRYTDDDHTWTFAGGEQLLLRFIEREKDYLNYHGWSIPWLGFEELTNWPNDGPFTLMISTNRTSNPKVRRRIRSTTNPYGVGHTWVKSRYRLPIPPDRLIGPIIKDALDRDGKPTHWRVAVRGRLEQNAVMLHATPEYSQDIGAAARNPEMLKAWLDEDWEVVAGAMVGDVWNQKIHVVPDFPLSKIPAGWYVDRSYDHGQSRPFSVGWWAESNGERFTWNGFTYGSVRGDLYRIGEWYGWVKDRPNEGLNMTAREIARGILKREAQMGLAGRVKPGPADTQIFDNSELREDGEKVRSVASDMEKEGVKWKHADKGQGTRKQGWQQLRTALTNAKAPRELPGVFALESCTDGYIRTIPEMPRDDDDLDDVDDKSEDHVGDEVRYRLRFSRIAPAAGWVW